MTTPDAKQVGEPQFLYCSDCHEEAHLIDWQTGVKRIVKLCPLHVQASDLKKRLEAAAGVIRSAERRLKQVREVGLSRNGEKRYTQVVEEILTSFLSTLKETPTGENDD